MTVDLRLLDAMRTHGLDPVKHDIIADGRIHRFRVDGDKPGSANGWYVLHLLPIPSATFGSWRNPGETHTFRDPDARPINRAERAELEHKKWEMRQARYREQVEVWRRASEKAAKLLRVSRPAKSDHPYLVRKGVKAYGIRQLRESLLIPLRDVDGRLHTLQFIDTDGGKRFLTGGQVQGHYYAIGRPGDTLCVCEGYATAASIYAATGHAVAVAFNAGNLLPVTRKLAIKFSHLKLIVCADDDNETPGNPGLTQAYRAARMVGGWVAKPDFSVVEAPA